MITDLPYFTHENDAKTNPKMEALRARYGWAGYGQFWALNEEIAHSKDARLDLSRKINRMSTAGKIGMNESQFDEFIAFLADPEIELVILVDGIMTTSQTQEDLARFRSRQAKNRDQYKSKKNSAAENQDSAAENENSAAEFSQSKQASERVEREELASGGGVVDNFPKTQEEEARFYAWALRKAKANPRNRDPSRVAKNAIMKDPEEAKSWRDEEAASKASRYLRCPEPPACSCGGTIRADRHDGTGQCIECGIWYEYDDDFRQWGPASPALDDFENTG